MKFQLVNFAYVVVKFALVCSAGHSQSNSRALVPVVKFAREVIKSLINVSNEGERLCDAMT
jgi:hypothetical protein